jgi:hypothetical protein
MNEIELHRSHRFTRYHLGLVECQAVGEILLGTEANPEAELGTDQRAQPLRHLDRKAHPSIDRASVPIGPLIRQRR